MQDISKHLLNVNLCLSAREQTNKHTQQQKHTSSVAKNSLNVPQSLHCTPLAVTYRETPQA